MQPLGKLSCSWPIILNHLSMAYQRTRVMAINLLHNRCVQRDGFPCVATKRLKGFNWQLSTTTVGIIQNLIFDHSKYVGQAKSSFDRNIIANHYNNTTFGGSNGKENVRFQKNAESSRMSILFAAFIYMSKCRISFSSSHNLLPQQSLPISVLLLSLNTIIKILMIGGEDSFKWGEQTANDKPLEIIR